jgi:MFS family permease
MLSALRRRDFALLWCGTLISLIGDRALMTALPFYVYQQTGSTLAMAGMFGASYLPGLLFGSVAGVFADRWDRKRILVAGNLIQAAVMLLLLLLHSGAWLWVVYVVTFTEQALGTLTTPAEGALLPSLVDEAGLLPANALVGVGNTVARLVGPLAGGLLIGLFGLPSVVLVDSASFLLAALLIGRIATRAPALVPAARAETVVAAWRQVGREWREGVRVIRSVRALAALFVVMNVTSLGGTLIDPLFAPFVLTRLHAGAEGLGMLSTINGAGGLLGGLVIGWIGARIPPRYLIGYGTVIVGLFMAALYSQTTFAVAAMIGCVMMIVVVSANVGANTVLQSATPDRYRGRVYGALGTSNALVGLVSVGAAGALGDILGIVPMLLVAAGITVLAGALGLILLPKDARPAPADVALRENLSPG